MKIAYIITRYKPNGGVFTSLDRLRIYLKEKNIETEAFVLGRNKGNYNFFNKKNNLKELLDFDIVELYHCWGTETIGSELLLTLKELIKQNKLIFRSHETKSIKSKSKTNHSSIVEELRDAVFILEGLHEAQYYKSKFNLNKVVTIRYIYNKINNKGYDLKTKNKIIVPSRLDFCKGLEFIKAYTESSYNKRRIEFYSKNINEAFVYFTKFNTILESDLYIPIEDYKSNFDKIYKDARILLNFTWFGEGSSGRAELIVMEGWDYGVIPFVDSRWAKDGDILKSGYNCIGIEKRNFKQLYEEIEKIFNDDKYANNLIKNGYESLNTIIKENDNIINFYNDFLNKNIDKWLIQGDNLKKGLLL